MSIHNPTPLEERISAALRQRAVREIEARNDLDAVAAVLDLMPTGVEALLRRSSWPLETAFRVLDVLGADVVREIEQAQLVQQEAAATSL